MKNKVIKLQKEFTKIWLESKQGIIDALNEKGIESLNIIKHCDEGGYDLPYANIYDRHLEGDFYEPITFIKVSNDDFDVYYNGESSGVIDINSLSVSVILDLFSVVADILTNETEYFTEKDEIE